MYELTDGAVPIVGVGGVSSGDDAYEKILHGASLVQVYTAFGFKGASLIPDIKTRLLERLKADGYHSISEAVGKAIK